MTLPFISQEVEMPTDVYCPDSPDHKHHDERGDDNLVACVYCGEVE